MEYWTAKKEPETFTKQPVDCAQIAPAFQREGAQIFFRKIEPSEKFWGRVFLEAPRTLISKKSLRYRVRVRSGFAQWKEQSRAPTQTITRGKEV